jgi:hypothetical protein
LPPDGGLLVVLLSVTEVDGSILISPLPQPARKATARTAATNELRIINVLHVL